jgi:hypothetical protein
LILGHSSARQRAIAASSRSVARRSQRTSAIAQSPARCRRDTRSPGTRLRAGRTRMCLPSLWPLGQRSALPAAPSSEHGSELHEWCSQARWPAPC